MIGKTISHYEITGELGRGGMGVVYKATDTKLNREIALKFLPPNVVATDKDRQRFRREAQSAAGLSHPNIATVFAIEETDEHAFIAMEFVDGETLRDVIDRAPLKIERAIEIAIQVAEGLVTAHEQQIVHRDIKPSNIMITSKGHVKIMDFGLAKVSQASMLTQAGSTLGTVGYMSPEQARGEDIDRRTDIWGLGCVLYEMISGRTPFAGTYEQAIVYSILNTDPEPLTALRSGVPIALDGIISKILAKDAGMRYQHVDELPADLRAIEAGATLQMSRAMPAYSGPMTSVAPSAMVAGTVEMSAVEVSDNKSPLAWLPWGIAAIGVAAALFFALSAGPATESEPVRRLVMPASPAEGNVRDVFSLSDDGTTLVFEMGSDPDVVLYARRLDEEESAPLIPMNGQGNRVVLSPDGRWAAYRIGSDLYRTSTSGGNPEKISSTRGGGGYFSWYSSSEMLFTTESEDKSQFIFLIIENGQERELARVDAPSVGNEIWFVEPIHGTDILIYTLDDDSSDESLIQLRAVNTSTKTDVLLAAGGANGRWVDNGYVVYFANGDLHAVPFNPGSMEAGFSFPIQTGILAWGRGFLHFDVSSNGVLAYLPGAQQQTSTHRVVFGPDEDALEPFSKIVAESRDPRISPDGTQILVQVQEGENDLWLLDLTLQNRLRLTDSPGEDETAAWDPDGVHFYYKSSADVQHLIRSNVTNSSQRDTLVSSPRHIHVESVSTDGRYVFYSLGGSDGVRSGRDIWVYDTQTDDGRELLATRFNEEAAALSPDGKWIVYTSNASGAPEVMLNRFPEMNSERVLSSGGGSGPVFSKSGNVIFYHSENRIMAIPFDDGNVSTANVHMNLPVQFADTGAHRNYDVLGDGEFWAFIDPGTIQGTNLDEFRIVTGLRTRLEQLDPAKN